MPTATPDLEDDTICLVATADQDKVGGLLVAKYPWLLRYSRRLTSDGAEARDIVQMVCARVLAQQATAAEVVNAEAWLRTVLFRVFVDVRRRSRWEIPTDLADLEQPATFPEVEHCLSYTTVDEVRKMVPSLPIHYRVPFELFTFENMSYASIASVMGLSCKTVATRISRARRRLRSLLEENQQD